MAIIFCINLRKKSTKERNPEGKVYLYNIHFNDRHEDDRNLVKNVPNLNRYLLNKYTYGMLGLFKKNS